MACGSGIASGATLSVTPNSVSNLYSGALTIQITGLTNGETVLVERFLDPNGNGVIDAGEPRVQSFLLTDGQAFSIGGVRDPNVPGDNDSAANGQITATLTFSQGPEFSRGGGAQIFRLSSPSGRFAAAQQAISVTQSVLPYKITGTVSAGGSPLAFALVGALMSTGNNQALVAAGTADASGNFSLSVSNGTYGVIGFKPGYTGNFGTSPQVTISGANTNVTVPLTSAPVTMSGTITDTSSGLGIAGVQFFATSTNNDYVAFFSDAQGNFSAPVLSSQWKLEPSDFSAALGGFLRPQNKTKVTVSGTGASGVSVTFTKASAMIYGTLKTDQGVALPGVQLFANDGSSLQSTADTDSTGKFFLLASNSTWFFGLDQGVSSLPPGYVLNQSQVTLSAGQAVLTNLVATQAAAYLAGKATDSNHNPISNGNMYVFSSGSGSNQNAPLAADGSFVFPLSAGTWTLSLDSQTAASMNLVTPQLQFTVTAGQNISNIAYVATITTRTISGSVKTATNSPISGLNVYAGANLNGTNFNANATTDANGNYTMPVLPGLWFVGLDSQGLSQRGYPAVSSQNVDTSAGNQTANFVVGGQPIGAISFRENMGIVGEFGPNSTPTVTYPVGPKNYRVMWHVFNDTNPPATAGVLFTGPPGSGLTNSPADAAFGVVQDGTNVYYQSPPVKSPSSAPGGTWTVQYNSVASSFQIPDPQVYAHLAVPLPTITLSNGLLTGLTWTYRDPNGIALSGIPGFVVSNRVDVFDQNGNFIYSDRVPATTSYSFPSTNLFPWASISSIRTGYSDSFTNQYLFNFTESSPTLAGAGVLSGHNWQVLLNAPAGANYTVQYSTTLNPGSWSTLYVTNVASSPVTILDPNATNTARFYRILVGP